MKKRLILSIALVLFFAGWAWCAGGSEPQTATATGGVATVQPPYQWADSAITESSDLQAWGGKKLDLVWWYGHGIGNLPPEKSVNDVVSPEVARVTGVSIDYDSSYSNGDNTFDVKLAMIAGTKDWPDIITNAQLIKPLVEGDVIYDLTELIPKYCPNLMKRYPMEVFKPAWEKDTVNGGFTGKIYTVPYGISANIVQGNAAVLMPDLDTKKFAAFAPPIEVHRASIKIRDDVVKKLFPQAKTQAEIETMFMEKGLFTRADVFDVPIKTKEDFIDMLYKIRDLNLKEGNLPVYATYAGCGLDNYPLGARLFSQLLGWGNSADNFTFWDNRDKKVKFSFQDPEYRDLWKTFNRLVREGVIPKESLIDDDTAFKEKMNNGQYAVTYAEWRWPDDALLKQQGKPYQYRKVYLDIPIRTDKYVQTQAIPSFGGWLAICKDSVAEEDVPQILRWIDYHFSDAYMNLVHWGPESAGLYTMADGKRKITDPKLEDALLYNSDLDLLMSYWLRSGFTDPGYQVRRLDFLPYTASKYSPYMAYDIVKRSKDQANRYFASGMVETVKTTMSNLPWIWIFPNTVKGVEKMWAARTTWEDALLKTLTATSAAEFDRMYDEFLLTTERIGLTPETLAEMNADFARQNKDFMANLMSY